jgi:cellobiose transport system permease protein
MSLSATRAPSPQAPPPPQLPPRRLRSKDKFSRFDIKFSPYFLIAPFFIVFGIFGLYPMLRTFWISLHNWNLINERRRAFVGLDNYAALLDDKWFWNATFNTVGLFLVATVPQLLLALVIANMLNRGLRARTFFRVSILVPNVTSVAAVGIVFATLFQRDFGVVNWLLSLVDIDAIDWRNQRWASWTVLATMVDWRWTGYNALIFLAGMQAIPKDLYESAAIDGASRSRQFWTITLPMLRPTLIFVVIVSTIGGLQLFTEPLILGQGTPDGGGILHPYQTLALMMFENGLVQYSRAGYGAAIGGMLFLMIMLFSLFNFILIRRSVR